MSRILLEDKQLVDPSTNDLITGKTTVRQMTFLHVKPNSVTVSYTSYLMGRNKHSDKLWGRWKSSGLASTYRTSTGKIAFLSRDNDGKPEGGTEAMYRMHFAMEYPDVRGVLEEFGIKAYADVYPALGIFADGNNPVNLGIVSSLIDEVAPRRTNGFKPGRRNFGSLHNDDPRELVSQVTRMPYRKDVARALRGKSLGSFPLFKYAGHIDSSWAADFISSLDEMEVEHRTSWVSNAAVAYDRGLISRDTYRKMVIEGRRDLGIDVIFVKDSFRMASQLLTPRDSRRLFKENSIAEIHQLLTDMTNAKKDELLSKPIEYSDEVQAIDGASVGKYKISLAKSAAEVKNWGRVQNHCIGSYAEASYDRYIHAAVMEGDKIAANFQLRNGYSDTINSLNHNKITLTQIYGYGNSQFEGAQEIHDWLMGKKVIQPSPYAGGMPRPNLDWRRRPARMDIL